MWPLDLKRKDQWPPFDMQVGRAERIKPLIFYHPHWVPSKPKMVLMKSQRFHSESNTWRRTDKENHLDREVFKGLFMPRDMNSNHWIRRKGSIASID